MIARALALMAAGMAVAHAVTPVPAKAFILHPVHPCDLSGKRLLFRPDAAGGYTVTSGKSPGPFVRGEVGGAPTGTTGKSGTWLQTLAFPFPFSGKKWTEVKFNYGGNLTFGASESEIFPALDTWPAGTMRWVAGGLDALALGRRALMIAPLWNQYAIESTKLYVNSSPREFIATWDAVRFQAPNEGYDPLGRNLFQVRLTPDGAIEIRYGAVSEIDGVAGIFTGERGEQRVLDSVTYPEGAASYNPQIRSASVEDAGTALHFALKLDRPLPKTAHEFDAGAVVITDSQLCRVGIRVYSGGQAPFSTCSGYAIVDGSTVDLYVSKLNLSIGKGFSWTAGTTDGAPAPRAVKFPNPGQGAIDLSAAHGHAAGNVYEVFHYPVISKEHSDVFQTLYHFVPPKDDLAMVVTDFRIDDIYNHSGGSSTLNLAIKGIGEPGEEPQPGMPDFGSSQLQLAVGPIYLGPRFQEHPKDAEHTYRNYAFAVGWMGHEFTHRWTAHLRSAALPAPDMLHQEDDCECHWSDWLHAPVVYPVWQLFSDTQYSESSAMGGYLFEPRGDGAFKRIHAPWANPNGFSALDLYAMGVLPPEKVPDTFLLTHTKDAGEDTFTGDKIPIRIDDIVKATGVRMPPAESAPHEFALGLYLLHDGPTPRPEKLAQLQAIEKRLVQYFSVATGGRIKLTPH